jgi:hypothetical protein
MPQSPTRYFIDDLPLTIPTDYIRRYFTESSEIFIAHAIITDGLAVGDLSMKIQTK